MLRAISSEGQIVHMYQQEEKVQNAPHPLSLARCLYALSFVL